MEFDFIQIFTILFALFMIWLGYKIKYEKEYGWIAGFNDYEENREKINQKYDMEKLGNLVGNSAFLYAGVLILLTLFSVNPFIIYGVATLVLFFNILIFSKRFKKN
jgi:hypothetical protein